MHEITTSKGWLTGEVEVRNPDGIHMRPSMAITRLCLALREHAGVLVLISATGADGSFIDAAADYDLAQAGFGVAYLPLAALQFQDGNRVVVRVGGPDVAEAQSTVVLNLVRELFADRASLEAGGTNPEYNRYLMRAGVPCA